MTSSKSAAHHDRQQQISLQTHSIRSDNSQVPVIAGVEITIDTEGRINLNELHRASGCLKKNGPSYWLALESTNSLIEELQSDTGISVSLIQAVKGNRSDKTQQGTFAHELLAISYAGWISPTFQLKVNQVFIDYRTGKLQPVVTQTIDFNNPTQVAGILAQSLGKVQEQAKQIKADKPKVDFHDKVAVTEGDMSVAKAAKLLGTGQNRLFAWLRRNRWVTRVNEPYQSKIECGLLDVKLGKHYVHPERGLSQSVTTRVTGKGLVALMRLLQSENQDSSERGAGND